MFDRKFTKETLKSIYKDFTDEKIESILDEMEYDERNIVKGHDVLHFSFIGGIIEEKKVAAFKQEVEKLGYKLSYRDKSRVMTASAVDAVNAFVIENPILSSFIIGQLSAIFHEFFMWAFKQAVEKVLKNSTRNNKFSEASTTFTVKVGEHKSITYVFPPDLPEKTISIGFKELFDATYRHQEKLSHLSSYYVSYKLKKGGGWKKTDVNSSLKKRSEKERRKKAKKRKKK